MGRVGALSRTLFGLGLGSLATAAVLFVLVLTGVIDGKTRGSTIDLVTPVGPPIVAERTPQPTESGPPPSDAPIASLAIPRFGIDAPVQVKGVDANNVMEPPDGPRNVAWYEFSSKPGRPGNAVFSGHVDYVNYGEAVFWHLKDLTASDTIEVHLEDQTVYKYAVQAVQSVPAEPTEEQLRAIVGPSTKDVITLITCGGTWNPETHQYDHRTVVRAIRVLDQAPAAASGA